ncbi:MAG: gephyrin-like molybdotransferase Glp [candidate division WOR-3 bacterium]
MEFLRLAKREEVYLNYFTLFRPLETEKVSIFEAFRRFVARDILSPEDVPPFPRSTVDGYALIAKDTFGASISSPSILRLVGEVKMAEEPHKKLESGEAMRIWTGGWLPEGADAVLMLENSSLDGELLEVYKPVAPGENILKIGDDVKKGEVIVKKGFPIRSQEMAILQTLGILEVEVHRRPRVIIIPTGNELAEPWQELRPGKIRESNSISILSLIKDYSEKVERHPIVPDDWQSIKSVIKRNLAAYDLLLLSGGSSKGVGDLVTSVIEDFEGGEIIYHGVSISPGKPTIFARIKEKPIIGLPGHPVSSFVATYLFALPLIKYLQGDLNFKPDHLGFLELGTDIPSKPGREEWIRVKREGNRLTPIYSESGVISSLVKADGLVRIPENVEGYHKGELVEFYPV